MVFLGGNQNNKGGKFWEKVGQSKCNLQVLIRLENERENKKYWFIFLISRIFYYTESLKFFSTLFHQFSWKRFQKWTVGKWGVNHQFKKCRFLKKNNTTLIMKVDEDQKPFTCFHLNLQSNFSCIFRAQNTETETMEPWGEYYL